MTKIDGIKQANQVKPMATERTAASQKTASDDAQRQTSAQGGNVSPAADSSAQRMAVIEAANTISSFVQNVSRELRFDVDEDTGRTVITVKDSTTDQVIRQIPGEEVLALAKVLEESPTADARGVLINSEA